MKNFRSSIAILAVALSVIGCYSGQSVTKGTIVMRTPTEAHINLGGDDGIRVGDTLSVWRDQTVGKVTRNIRVGEVKVTKILGNNYAAVEVLTGNVNENDVVEKGSR